MTGNRVRQLKALLLGLLVFLGLLAIPNFLSAQVPENAPSPRQNLSDQSPNQKASPVPVDESPADQSTADESPADQPPTHDTDPEDDQSVEKKRAEKRKLRFKKQGGVVYQTIDGEELKCDIYTPEGEGPFPAILAVHGGAWRQGSKFALIRHAWKMAQAGYVVVAINYRHAPKHRFPAQIHDCKHAIRWMKSRANEMKIDSKHIGAFGYSAGGHLVSLLGTSDADDGLEGEVSPEMEKFETRIQAVAAGGAPCEFSWIDDDSQVLSYWLGGSPIQKPDAYRTASPTTYVSADDPAFFLFHGTADLIVPASSSLKLHQTLEKTGISTQHYKAEGNGHFSTFSDIGWMEKAIEFFDDHLKNDKEPTSKPPGKPSVENKISPADKIKNLQQSALKSQE